MITEHQVRQALGKVRENLDAEALPADADFGEAGLDSLDHASLLLELQERTGVVFPDGAEGELTSIRAIVDFGKSPKT